MLKLVEIDRLEDEIADLNAQIVAGMAMADANRVQAEAALAAMTSTRTTGKLVHWTWKFTRTTGKQWNWHHA